MPQTLETPDSQTVSSTDSTEAAGDVIIQTRDLRKVGRPLGRSGAGTQSTLCASARPAQRAPDFARDILSPVSFRPTLIISHFWVC